MGNFCPNLKALFIPTLSMLSDESKHVFLAYIRYAANYGILSQHRVGTAIYGLLIGRWGCEGYGIQAVYTGIGTPISIKVASVKNDT